MIQKMTRRRLMAAGLAIGVAERAGAARAAAPGVRVSPPLPDPIAAGGLIYDVRPAGYVAEEVLLSGRADVHDSVTMADSISMLDRDNVKDLGRRQFDHPVIAAAVPYVTRVVVYRPADPARASGRVVVEASHPERGGALTVFSFMNDVFTSNGDVHVSVSIPVVLETLRHSDPVRYGALSARHPSQVWGMLRDVAAVLKGGGSLLPPAFPVRTLVMTGYSYTGVATATFANFMHDKARGPGGRPLYDGYLPMANATYVRDIDAPVLRMNTQSDFDSFGGLNNRKPDSDAASGRARLYEVPGCAHVRKEAQWPGLLAAPPALKNFVAPPGLPTGMGNQCTTGFPAGSHENDFPLHHYTAAAFDNLYAWIERGTPPPPGALIATDAQGRTRVDALGNAEGGLRSCELDVPVSAYGVGHDACRLFGYTLPLGAARVDQLYGGEAGYRARLQARTAALVSARLLRPREARMIQDTAAARPNRRA